LSIHEEKIRQQNREAYLQSQVNELWRTIPRKKEDSQHGRKRRFPPEPQENLLYFFEKNAPLLEPWQREIIRIVRKMAQYFYPQTQTKLMNEGWATFWHYTLINALYDEGLVTDAFMLEVLENHTNVLTQHPFDHPNFAGINPYALGFKMFQEIRRICESPTEEDEQYFPQLVHTNWQVGVDNAMRHFKDESFIAQYLSPNLIRELKLFQILDDDERQSYLVRAIHDERGYGLIREALSKEYQLRAQDPNIQVYSVDMEGNRTLTLQYLQHQRIPLAETVHEVLKHLYLLWKFPVRLDIIDEQGETVKTYLCPEDHKEK
jgi:stage V sporulation protein R